MNLNRFLIIIISVYLFIWLTEINADNPCAARQNSGESVTCVCNATYCDNITRDAPASGQYVVYESSESGLRFNKSVGNLQTYSSSCCDNVLVLDPNVTYQTIEGFGGAVTDSAGINWKNLSQVLQKSLIDSYFSDAGLQYNMIRVPIAGSDFSTRVYSYNDLPEDDVKLTNFTLAYEDFEYKIPMIKACQSASSEVIHIVATAWSPPTWMKTNDKITGFSRLIPKYYQTYADYHYKFLEKYSAENISIWGITTTNEPLNGVIPLARFNSLGWSANHMGDWIINNLGPTIRNSTFKNLKIITVDDQRYTIPIWFNLMVATKPKVLNYIDGVGIHWYGNLLSPPEILELVTKTHPELFLLGTEASAGAFPWQTPKVLLGSWSRAVDYIKDILVDLNYNMVGWMDWNMCLNSQGGPNWAKNYVDSPVIVFPENNEFVKQPMFYAMGHFSKFVPRGSIRIKVRESKSKSVQHVAFITPHNTVVAVVYNGGSPRKVGVSVGDKQAVIEMQKKSIATVEFPYDA